MGYKWVLGYGLTGHHEFPGFSKWFTGSPQLRVPSIILSIIFLLLCSVQPPTLPSTLPSHPPACHVTGPPPPPPPPRTAGQRPGAPAPAHAPARLRPRARPRARPRVRPRPSSPRPSCWAGLLRPRCAAVQARPFPAIFEWFTGHRSNSPAPNKPYFWAKVYLIWE
jgi:hypothetical protein